MLEWLARLWRRLLPNELQTMPEFAGAIKTPHPRIEVTPFVHAQSDTGTMDGADLMLVRYGVRMLIRDDGIQYSETYFVRDFLEREAEVDTMNRVEAACRKLQAMLPDATIEQNELSII